MDAVDVERVDHHLARDLPDFHVSKPDLFVDPPHVVRAAVNAVHAHAATHHAPHHSEAPPTNGARHVQTLMSHETFRHPRSGLHPTLRLEPEDGFPSKANDVRGKGQHAHHHGSIGI